MFCTAYTRARTAILKQKNVAKVDVNINETIFVLSFIGNDKKAYLEKKTPISAEKT